MATSPGSCLTCIHFERMYRTCKYDERARSKAQRRLGHVRINARTDLRTFRCNDYLAWEVGLLPFIKPESPEHTDEAHAGEIAQGR